MLTWGQKARLRKRAEVSGPFPAGLRSLGSGGKAVAIAPQGAAGKLVLRARGQVGIAVKKSAAGIEHRSYSGKAIDISTGTVMERHAKALNEAG